MICTHKLQPNAFECCGRIAAFVAIVMTNVLSTTFALPTKTELLPTDIAQTEKALAAQTLDDGWPREFSSSGHVVRIFEPQIEHWKAFERLEFYCAIAVAEYPRDSETSAQREWIFGTMHASAATEVSLDDRLVVLSDQQIESITFADVTDEEAAEFAKIVTAAAPADRPQTISLDRLVAAIDASEADVRRVPVEFAPPRIVWSDREAILVTFTGMPRFKPVSRDNAAILFAINTNWDVFLDSASGRYYLLDDQVWLTTKELHQGPWTGTEKLPMQLARLPNDENWSDVRAALPARTPTTIPVVYVATTPTELIVTDGLPEFEAIPNTRLMLVTNTDNDLVYDGPGAHYYLLAAGRWFRAPSLSGPWSEASASLPLEFRLIPEDSIAGHLLASIPGTADADEAAILASIPQKAEVDRSRTMLEVTYEGTPIFLPIPTTTVLYATNTPYDVFCVDKRYYCCFNAVWFFALTPLGPWMVADWLPVAIYTIPPNFPGYNVTYVRIYEATPTTVVVGYTAGYTGATVATTGVVMFGLGVVVGTQLSDHDWWWPHHHRPFAFSYGCGAVWHRRSGGFIAWNHRYGPYGGAGHGAIYSPTTGKYTRGGLRHGPEHGPEHGPHRGPHHGDHRDEYRAAYNPATANDGARVSSVAPYATWSRGVTTHGERWMRGATETAPRPSAGAVRGSGGGESVRDKHRWANGTTVAHDHAGDLYAGHDGNVYRKSESGWEQIGVGRGTATDRSARKTEPAAARQEKGAVHRDGATDTAKDDAHRDQPTKAPTGTAPKVRTPPSPKPTAGQPPPSKPTATKPTTTEPTTTKPTVAKRTPATVRPVPQPPTSVARDAHVRQRADRAVQHHASVDSSGSRGTAGSGSTRSRPTGGGRPGGSTRSSSGKAGTAHGGGRR